VALPRIGAHPQLGKLTLTNRLPRRPGVYVFRDAGRRPLYVGKAVDLRRRVRSYFTGDDRRKVGGLLRELHTVDHVECSSELEASVLEVRMIHELAPRYNSRTKHWRSYAYVKVTLDEAWPRLSVVRQPRPGDGCVYVGPVGSVGTAQRIASAIQEVVPLRRCTARVGADVCASRPLRSAPCTPAQLGVATCPCAGAVGREDYAATVGWLVASLTSDPTELLARLGAKLARLAAQQRFEEAADLRDRAAALARALDRQRRYDALRTAGRVRVELRGGAWAVIESGVLRGAGAAEAGGSSAQGASRAQGASCAQGALPVGGEPPASGSPWPVPRHLVDELATIAAWLDARAGSFRMLECERGLALPRARLASFEPRGG